MVPDKMVREEEKRRKGEGEGRREKGEGRREKGERSKEKGEGRREKGEGRREKGEGRREKGERRGGEIRSLTNIYIFSLLLFSPLPLPFFSSCRQEIMNVHGDASLVLHKKRKKEGKREEDV